MRSYRIATGIMNSPEPSSFPEALALIAPISTEDVAALPSTSTAQAQALSPSPFQCPGSRLQGRTGVPRPASASARRRSVSIDNVSSMSAAKCEL